MGTDNLNFEILPELEHYLNPLQGDALQDLESQILAYGVRDALIVGVLPDGKKVLVDGHNRYKICEKHGIAFKTTEINFSSIVDIEEFMEENQSGRRNLTEFQTIYFRGKKAKAKTKAELAKIYQINEKTIQRDKIFYDVMGKLGEINPKLKVEILNGSYQINRGDIELLKNFDLPEQIADIEQLKNLIKEAKAKKTANKVQTTPPPLKVNDQIQVIDRPTQTLAVEDILCQKHNLKGCKFLSLPNDRNYRLPNLEVNDRVLIINCTQYKDKQGLVLHLIPNDRFVSVKVRLQDHDESPILVEYSSHQLQKLDFVGEPAQPLAEGTGVLFSENHFLDKDLPVPQDILTEKAKEYIQTINSLFSMPILGEETSISFNLHKSLTRQNFQVKEKGLVSYSVSFGIRKNGKDIINHHNYCCSSSEKLEEVLEDCISDTETYFDIEIPEPKKTGIASFRNLPAPQNMESRSDLKEKIQDLEKQLQEQQIWYFQTTCINDNNKLKKDFFEEVKKMQLDKSNLIVGEDAVTRLYDKLTALANKLNAQKTAKCSDLYVRMSFSPLSTSFVKVETDSSTPEFISIFIKKLEKVEV